MYALIIEKLAELAYSLRINSPVLHGISKVISKDFTNHVAINKNDVMLNATYIRYYFICKCCFTCSGKSNNPHNHNYYHLVQWID